MHNNRLVVSGESTLSEDTEKEGYAVRERILGRFSRLPLPDGTKSQPEQEVLMIHVECQWLFVANPVRKAFRYPLVYSTI